MSRELLNVGDRLVQVVAPGPTVYRAGSKGVLSIGVSQLPGPMGFYLVANIIFETDRADEIVPLYMCESVSVLNPS